ncbi:autotransporter outer membrane beta-barrel domain-containing protein [Aquamicrobium sp. LC103]|nr:autotransporter outer membrane beta-barrel domain-containing protein [Aquamicrobium sp. LC103]
MSAPGTITFRILARPNPSLDPEVIGLIRAQTETAKRFANTQITNFNQRLEQLHNESERRSNSVGVNVGVQQPSITPDAYAPQEDAHDPALKAIGRAAPVQAERRSDPQPAPVDHPFGNLAFWSGGFVNFGTNDNGAINLDHTLVGVSAGVDYRFTSELTAGFGLGYGRDVTEVGSNGTESRAEAFSLAAYGSYRPVPGLFIDGLAGYSAMSFDSLRHVTATGDYATGTRGGDQFFASLTAGYEYRNEGLLISPYGRLSGSRSTLDAFTETGAGMWNLTYGEQRIDTLSGTLGLRLEYAISTDWGALKPRGRLEYTHDFEGTSRASLGYADIGTPPYELDIEGFSRNHLAIGLGLDARIGEDVTLGFDYRTALGTNGDSRDHTFGLKLGVQF